MIKSFNFDKQNTTLSNSPSLPTNMVEHLCENGCSGVYSSGPLLKPRYINPKLEKELIDFKIEVEGKFKKSTLLKFVFPRVQDKVQNDYKDGDLTSFLVDAEVKLNITKSGLKTGRRYIDHGNLNYSTEGVTKTDTSFNQSLTYDQNYESANMTVIKGKYDVQFDQILKQNGIYQNPTTKLNKLKRRQQEDNSTESTSRFKDINNSYVRMPELLGTQKSQFQAQARSQDRYQQNQIKTSRIQSGITNNFINLNNPQVIIQSPQNNTIILVDSKIKETSSRNHILQSLEKNGLIHHKYDHQMDSQVNKRYYFEIFQFYFSFQGDQNSMNTFRNLQQSRIFEQYIKQQKTSTNAQHYTSRNKINIQNQGRIKYETNRSQVRKDIANAQNKEFISKSFIFPPTTLGSKHI